MSIAWGILVKIIVKSPILEKEIFISNILSSEEY